MIYLRREKFYIPVQVEACKQDLGDWGTFTRYKVRDNKIPVGYVDLQDTQNGCKVLYIKNQNPDLYAGFGKLADQIEVEHCLNRGIKNPYIYSQAALGTLMQHFKRGKKFLNESINIYFQNVLNQLKKGERFSTEWLGIQDMFMPQKLINECIERIKRNPILNK